MIRAANPFDFTSQKGDVRIHITKVSIVSSDKLDWRYVIDFQPIGGRLGSGDFVNDKVIGISKTPPFSKPPIRSISKHTYSVPSCERITFATRLTPIRSFRAVKFPVTGISIIISQKDKINLVTMMT